MSLRSRLFGRPRPWRLLRDGIRVLVRIATALEQQNALIAATHPEAAARLRARHAPEPESDSSVSYLNPEEALRAEQIRWEVQRETGRYLNDEQLIDYLQAQELIVLTREQGLS